MNTLETLLKSGFETVTPDDLPGIAMDTRDRCWSTGDVRYCIASDVLEIIESCWGDDRAVRSAVVQDIDGFIRNELSNALGEPDPETARYLTMTARSNLISLIESSGDLLYG